MSINEFSPQKFSIHIHGFSLETLEVIVCTKKSDQANKILHSVLKNIQKYLSCHLGLDKGHLYANIGVRSLGKLQQSVESRQVAAAIA
jgi:hypothetical protein